MRWQLECAPCFMRQALGLRSVLGLDEAVVRKILRAIGCQFCSIKDEMSPPEFAIGVYQAVAEISGVTDPYEDLKEHSNQVVLAVEGELKRKILESPDPLRRALLFAIAGNIIDFGVAQDVNILGEVEAILKSSHEIVESPYFEISDFFSNLEKARSILYIGDNCGEVVFDKLFIELLRERFPELRIWFGVRGGPIINDVTENEARVVGLDKLCEVVSTGVPAPGVILERSSEEFLEVFWSADMVISKGQGNFESLSEVDREVFFLFRAKCDVVANYLGCEKNQILLIRNSRLGALLNAPPR